jgi:hypothetical protein
VTQHLTARVAWHEERWNGTVCNRASANSYCLDLDRIREERNDSYEDSVGLTHFADLAIDRLPPCRAESGAFMSGREIPQIREHPYQTIPKAQSTHGVLRPTVVKVPPYSTLVVPFRWMLRQNQEAIEDRLPVGLPPDEESPFPSAWVFSSARQESLSRRLQGGFVARGERHRCALGAERLCRRCSDATARARDDGNLPGEERCRRHVHLRYDVR